jgi:hypothetical protein
MVARFFITCIQLRLFDHVYFQSHGSIVHDLHAVLVNDGAVELALFAEPLHNNSFLFVDEEKRQVERGAARNPTPEHREVITVELNFLWI